MKAPGPGKSKRIEVEGVAVALFRVGERLYAIDAACTHLSGPLDEGTLNGTAVECPWHGSVFSVETGQVLRGPAMEPVRAYKARMEGTTLVLETD